MMKLKRIPRLIAFLGIVMIANVASAQETWSASMNISGSEGTLPSLMFGFSYGATDGYDEGSCSDPALEGYTSCVSSGADWAFDAYAPPPPPAPAFDVALSWDNDRYFSQIVLATNDETTFGIDFMLSESGSTIDFTWDSSEIASFCTSARLQDPFGGQVGVDVDMLATSSLTLNGDTPLTSLNIIITASLSIGESAEMIPQKFALFQNYPNPFNPTTSIHFDLPSDEMVSIDVYNLFGQKVTTLVNNTMIAGSHSVVWNGKNTKGTDVAAGIYLYTIDAGDFKATKKMILLK